MKAAVSVCALATVLLVLGSCSPDLSPSEQTGSPMEVPEYSRTLEGVESAGPITLLACGDILLSRSVADRISRNGYSWPFRNTKEIVASADIAFCNLENPASFVGKPYPGKPPNVTFRADPGALFGLKWAGFDVASLANNHMNDYGGEAVRETLDCLEMLGISTVGAGVDEASSRAPVVLNRNGAKIAFLAYVEKSWGVVPAGDHPGVAVADLDTLATEIETVRRRERPDYIVVSVHWGEELQSLPGAFQREFGHAAIDAGASIVLGHHPHVLQSLEVYKSGVIAYSLGNFIFDMDRDGTYDTAAFRFSLARGKVREVEVIPLRIERYEYAPRPATSKEAKRILEGLQSSSQTMGAKLDILDGRGYLRF